MPRRSRTRRSPRGRRYYRAIRRRTPKPSLVDYASLSPGALKSLDQVGGIDGAMKNPQAFGGLIIENYLGYDPDTGTFGLNTPIANQWKAFAGIQIGKAILLKVAPKLKRFKLFGHKLF